MRTLLAPLATLAGLVAVGDLPAQFSNANYPSAAAPTGIAQDDLDGDGDRDLALAHASIDAVSANINNGGGTSWTAGGLFTYPAGSNPFELAIAELNGSGRPDLAVVLRGSNTVAIHLATGGFPGFAAPQIVPVGGTPIEVVAFDLELDGDDDLAVLCQSPPEVRVLGNNGAGVFSSVASIPLAVGPHAITSANFNSAGPEDLVVTGSAGTAFAEVLINTSVPGTPSFAGAQSFPVDFRPFGVCAGDFNGDGLPDIATAGAAFSTTTVLLSNAGALAGTTVGFTGTTYPLAPGVIAGPGTEIECADFDCDGAVDLAVCCNFTNNVAWLRNGGGGSPFLPPIFEPTPNGPTDLVVGDFNGDGNDDIGTANTASNDVSILLNQVAPGCCRHILVGGIIDGFSNATPPGPEDACPGPQLLAAFGSVPRRDFDGPVQCSRIFMHTFGNLPSAIKRARLRLVFRADCISSPGDVFGLGFETTSSFFRFSTTMSTLTGSPFTIGSTAGVSLDLEDLPGGIDLLQMMNADGRLDLFIRSGTAVDYAYLELESCARTRDGMNLNVSPIVFPGTTTWSVSGAPPLSTVVFLLGPAIGPGPATPIGQLCLLSPSILAAVPASSGGAANFSLTFPALPFLPCFTLSSQAAALIGSGGVLSNTHTSQVFD